MGYSEAYGCRNWIVLNCGNLLKKNKSNIVQLKNMFSIIALN